MRELYETDPNYEVEEEIDPATETLPTDAGESGD